MRPYIKANALYALLLCVLLVVVACNQVIPTPVDTQPVSPLQATSPLQSPAADLEIEAGLSAVVGRILSSNTGQALNREVVRLAEVYCPEGITEEEKEENCFWALSNAWSPSTFTDSEGYFQFENVEARDYVILVGDLITKYAIVYSEGEKPMLVTAAADVATDVGTVVVDY
jgi:hypothetical protein